MTWIVDIVLVLILATAGYIGYKKGAVRMLLSFLALALSVALAFVISAPLAQLSYGWFFEKSISATVDAALENQTMETALGAAESLLSEKGAIGGLGKLLGFDTQQALSSLSGDSVSQIGDTLKNTIIRPPMVLLLQIIVFLLFFVLLWLILSAVTKALSRAARLPLVRGVNALFGGVVGAAVGALLCLGVCLLFNLLIQINPNGILGITAITRENSVIYRFISDTFLAL